MGDHEEKTIRTSRRKFLASGFVAAGGIFLSGLFVLRSVLLFLFPKSGDKEFTKFLVGKVKDIPVGKSKEILIADTPVFVTHLPEGFKAFSGVCPHLGCIVKWKEREKQFYCPCHRAVFGNDGTVLAGPSPRPLDEFSVEVEGPLVFMHIRKRERII